MLYDTGCCLEWELPLTYVGLTGVASVSAQQRFHIAQRNVVVVAGLSLGTALERDARAFV